MSDFIYVLGEDPNLPANYTYQYIAISAVVRVCPLFTRPHTKDKRRLLLCAGNHPGATLQSYLIFTQDGHSYTCGDLDEIGKLGIELPSYERIPQRFYTTGDDEEVTGILDPMVGI